MRSKYSFFTSRRARTSASKKKRSPTSNQAPQENWRNRFAQMSIQYDNLQIQYANVYEAYEKMANMYQQLYNMHQLEEQEHKRLHRKNEELIKTVQQLKVERNFYRSAAPRDVPASQARGQPQSQSGPPPSAPQSQGPSAPQYAAPPPFARARTFTGQSAPRPNSPRRSAPKTPSNWNALYREIHRIYPFGAQPGAIPIRITKAQLRNEAWKDISKDLSPEGKVKLRNEVKVMFTQKSRGNLTTEMKRIKIKYHPDKTRSLPEKNKLNSRNFAAIQVAGDKLGRSFMG